jgi:hypothetical protein
MSNQEKQEEELPQPSTALSDQQEDRRVKERERRTVNQPEQEPVSPLDEQRVERELHKKNRENTLGRTDEEREAERKKKLESQQ